MNNTQKPRAPFLRTLVCSVIYLGATIALFTFNLGGSISPEGVGTLTLCALVAVIVPALIAKDSKTSWSWMKLTLVTFAVYAGMLFMTATSPCRFPPPR